MSKLIYTGAQLKRLSVLHKLLCAIRDVEPRSAEGREVALRLLEDCDGEEPDTTMLGKQLH